MPRIFIFVRLRVREDIVSEHFLSISDGFTPLLRLFQSTLLGIFSMNYFFLSLLEKFLQSVKIYRVHVLFGFHYSRRFVK